jgi:hypothetical protein
MTDEQRKGEYITEVATGEKIFIPDDMDWGEHICSNGDKKPYHALLCSRCMGRGETTREGEFIPMRMGTGGDEEE